MFTFTTSWDDGDARDMRVLALLKKYGMCGTFYITRDQKNRLTEDQIREIAMQQEIGAHTLHHPNLTTLATEQKRDEIGEGKKWLEEVIDKEVTVFCYPYGCYDDESKRITKEAGFIGARTTDKTLGTIPTDPFALPVTILSYRAPFGLAQKLAFPFLKGGVANSKWETLIRQKLQTVSAENGVFHLWGHSWEIDKLDLWESLENFLIEISKRSDVEFATNGELVQKYFPS